LFVGRPSHKNLCWKPVLTSVLMTRDSLRLGRRLARQARHIIVINVLVINVLVIELKRDVIMDKHRK